METETPSLPVLSCPHCNTNILDKGFHNTCTETQDLREDNHTYVWKGLLIIDHDEDDYQTIDHECDVDAFCANCDQLLPWPLYSPPKLWSGLA
jgi:hypothetical protein